MRRILLSALMAVSGMTGSYAQAVIFTEDFSGTSGVSLPAGWTEYNVDNKTVVSNLSGFNFGSHAWVTSANSTIAQSAGNRFVVSTSWYNPVGASDDWLVTPAITLTTSNAIKWMAKAQDPSFPDGYQVKISTTGNAIADFTTNLLTVPAEASTWSLRSLDLSAYSGQTVYIAFRNNSNDKYLLCIDDVQVVSLPANDVALTGVTPAAGTSASYNTVGTINTIKGEITNNGSNPITSLLFKYSDGVNTYTDTKSGLNIPTFGTATLTHSTSYTTPSLGQHQLTAWVELTGDANTANDTSLTTIQGVSFLPTHKVVFEEGTGTWCGWCPRGTVFMDSMANVHGNESILIAVHNGDPMVFAAYDAGIGGLISGYPSVVVNRNIVVDPSDMFTEFNAHTNDFGFASLTPVTTYNFANNSFDIAVNADFAADLSGDYRLACVITEDNRTGTTSTWAQTNYYSFQSQNLPLQGAGHNWQAEPSSVPAANMEYDHVARTILGGFDGQTGSLPATISAGSTHSYNFTYPIPAGMNIYNTHIIALLIDATNKVILNGNSGSFTLGLNENDDLTGQFNLFPNPASSQAFMAFTLKQQNPVSFTVTNLLGETIMTSDLGLTAPGSYQVELNNGGWDNGLYFVTLTVGNKKVTEKLSVNN